MTANIAVKLLRAMFNKAIDWEYWNKPNPARGIQLFKEKSRDRFLQPDELPRFFQALADESNETIRDFVLVALMTGVRRDNVMTMRWEDVQLDRGEWRIPHTKSGTEHVLPLLPEAMTILRARKIARGESEYVFPGTGAQGHLVEPKKGWRRILDRAELIQLVDWIAKEQGWPKPQADAAKAAIDVSRALKEARSTAKALHIDAAPARIKDLRIHDLRRTVAGKRPPEPTCR